MIDEKFLADEAKDCAECGQSFRRDKRCTWKHWERAKFCSRTCSTNHWAKLAADRRLPLDEDFQRWFDRTDGCWLWNGAVDRDGYGIFSYEAKTYRAAKIALVLDGRGPKKGEFACHKCDNPRCVRPDHLYPGTPQDNVRDMIDRRRANWAKRLTEQDVREIRGSNESKRALAQRFSVTEGTIAMVLNRTTWRHI